MPANPSLAEQVNMLLTAYRENTLLPTSCARCACGLLVALSNDYPLLENWFTPDGTFVDTSWAIPAWGYREGPRSVGYATGLQQIEATGYTLAQFSQLEKTFMGELLPKDEEIREGKLPNREGNRRRLLRLLPLMAELRGEALAPTLLAELEAEKMSEK
jgi:hypothetical protein